MLTPSRHVFHIYCEDLGPRKTSQPVGLIEEVVYTPPLLVSERLARLTTVRRQTISLFKSSQTPE